MTFGVFYLKFNCMKSLLEEINQANAKFLGKCPVCAASIKPENVAIVQKKDGAYLLHSDCENCSSSAFMIMVPGPMNLLATLNIMTDVTKEDLKREADFSLVTSDDVLKMHLFLDRKHRA